LVSIVSNTCKVLQVGCSSVACNLDRPVVSAISHTVVANNEIIDIRRLSLLFSLAIALAGFLEALASVCGSCFFAASELSEVKENGCILGEESSL
jgi:hypothetical protein